MDAFEVLLDWRSGDAWPFLVRGLACLLDCDNERDPYQPVGECPGGTPLARAGRQGAITGL